MITDCQPDPERLAVVHQAMETYDYGSEVEENETDVYAEWPSNILSLRTVIYSCGAICRDGDATEHNHEEIEFALCQRLSAEAAKIMEGVHVGMGSEAFDTKASPFFIVANAGDAAPASGLTDDLIRHSFGGTLFPLSPIEVVPLMRESKWGEQIRDYYWNEEPPPVVNVALLTMQTGDAEISRAKISDWDDETRLIGERWFELSDWFAAQPDLHDASFVSVLEPEEEVYMYGSVYPRLAVALTAAGSIVGIYYDVVHT